MHFQCYIHAPLTRPLVIINTLICHLNKLEVVGFIYYILVAKQLRTCARARASVCTHACTSTCARTVHTHALAFDVQLTTFDPCGAPAHTLGTWRTDAQGRRWSAAAAADTAGLNSPQSSSFGEAVWDSFSAR